MFIFGLRFLLLRVQCDTRKVIDMGKLGTMIKAYINVCFKLDLVSYKLALVVHFGYIN